MRRIVSFINYTTRAGDTFDSLALTMYNEEKLAHYIIESNPDHADVIIFDANIQLRLPVMDSVETPETFPPWRQDEELET